MLDDPTGICPESPRPDGVPLRHEAEIEYGEPGKYGYPPETHTCIYCGEVMYEYSGEEVTQHHIADLLYEGQMDRADVPDELLDAEVVQEALERRPTA